MVQFNFSERTIKAKVVYYGPAQSGKTTNLEQIHRFTDPAGQNRLISLNTAQDRTLFFDLLPFSLGAVSGYDFKIQLYTVPGQVQYNATRRVVLAGADAVVFVADSQRSLFKENVAAFENMKVNLLANRLVPEKVPLVLQFNKRDLPDLQAEAEMNRALNPWGRPHFAAVAARGEGVMESFVAVVQEMLRSIALKYNLKEKGLDPAAIPQIVSEAFSNVLRQAASAAESAPPETPAPSPPRIVVSQSATQGPGPSLQAGPEASLVSEELLHRAIRSNVELAEALADLTGEMNEGLKTILAQAEQLEGEVSPPPPAVDRIKQEASRLRRIMQQLGEAGAAADARRPQPQRAAPPPAPPRVRAPAAPATTIAVTPADLGATLREALATARPVLEARGLSVDLRVPPGTAPPRCPPPNVSRAVASLLRGISAVASPGSAAVLRCERKPVLLRSRDGGEVRRDFLMLALAHGGSLSPEEQQRILQGNDPGPLGEAFRLVREMGGFVRFAPLPDGQLESRLFLPSA